MRACRGVAERSAALRRAAEGDPRRAAGVPRLGARAAVFSGDPATAGVARRSGRSGPARAHADPGDVPSLVSLSPSCSSGPSATPAAGLLETRSSRRARPARGGSLAPWRTARGSRCGAATSPRRGRHPDALEARDLPLPRSTGCSRRHPGDALASAASRRPPTGSSPAPGAGSRARPRPACCAARAGALRIAQGRPRRRSATRSRPARSRSGRSRRHPAPSVALGLRVAHLRSATAPPPTLRRRGARARARRRHAAVLGIALRTSACVGDSEALLREAIAVFETSDARLIRPAYDLGAHLRRAERRRGARDPARALDTAHRAGRGALAIAPRRSCGRPAPGRAGWSSPAWPP